MKTLLYAFLITGFYLCSYPAGYAQTGSIPFAHGLQTNKALFVQGDSMHIPLSPALPLQQKPFSRIVDVPAWQDSGTDASWQVHPVMEGYYELSGADTRMFAAAGATGDYLRPSLRFNASAMAGYSQFSGMAYRDRKSVV